MLYWLLYPSCSYRLWMRQIDWHHPLSLYFFLILLTSMMRQILMQLLLALFQGHNLACLYLIWMNHLLYYQLAVGLESPHVHQNRFFKQPLRFKSFFPLFLRRVLLRHRYYSHLICHLALLVHWLQKTYQNIYVKKRNHENYFPRSQIPFPHSFERLLPQHLDPLNSKQSYPHPHFNFRLKIQFALFDRLWCPLVGIDQGHFCLKIEIISIWPPKIILANQIQFPGFK